MNGDRTKVGVVGVGHMGVLHLQKYLGMANVEVVGIYEPNRARADQLVEQYGVKAHPTLAELLFDADAISIASPTRFHFLTAKAAFLAGVDVLVEKPVCSHANEAEELVRIAKGQGAILQAGFIERFRYRELSKDMTFGPVRFLETHRLSPSLGRDSEIDVISDLMIHDLDLVLSIVGETPTHVSAVATPVLTSRYDLANVRLEFPSGSVANLNASRVSLKAERKLRLFTTNSYVSMDFITNDVAIAYRTPDKRIESRSLKNPQVDALQQQLEVFVDCVKNRRQSPVNGVDGLAALRVLERIMSEVEARAKPPGASESVLWT